MNITYRQVGDYLIPNIKLAEEDKQPIGKYGMMRKDFLYNNKQVHFNIMLMNGELTKHLLSVQQEAEKMLNLLITQMSREQGVTEELKENDQMKWVGLMNNIQHFAEEIVLKEIVYA